MLYRGCQKQPEAEGTQPAGPGFRIVSRHSDLRPEGSLLSGGTSPRGAFLPFRVRTEAQCGGCRPTTAGVVT
ncbi:hypothetical protein LDC_1644 [sediment metagenome]|uniref:Uncharacterized protein n=1 Tax=sediment metagenome TaxID=749907 RepID=D9PJD5_9ZZZZ